MSEYTYADVIIDPNDPRVEIGKEYYVDMWPSQCIDGANEGKGEVVLTRVDSSEAEPFFAIIDGEETGFTCAIRKKEAEKKYVPFDLGDPEIRENLRGNWVVADGDEGQISGFHRFDGEEWMAAITTGYVTSEMLFDKWKFVDGSPCGRLVEEET